MFDLLNEILGYHGTDSSKLGANSLKPPIFVALDKHDARWYAINWGGDHSTILTGEINVSKPLDCINGDGHEIMLKLARKARIKFETEPYFHCPEISKHSHYDGGNLNDLVYIPKFQAALKAAGYDSIHTWDTLENTQPEVYILFDTNQFKVTDREAVSIDDEDY